jgi:leader peptidase (prepilin peptidase)/N-methyltransferase
MRPRLAGGEKSLAKFGIPSHCPIRMSEPNPWAAAPFHFWTVVFFVFGAVVGSFLNVCIHRMPRGESIVSPPSHCPHCNYSIPWWLNIPLVTWVFLRGKCRNCGAAISARYFLVELLTAALFAGLWVRFGAVSPWIVLSYCLLIGGLIAATFIDFEHFIIPDEITIGGIGAGLVCSFAFPELQTSWPGLARHTTSGGAVKESLIGLAVGAGLIYGVLRLGKLFLGKYKIEFTEESLVVFDETGMKLPEEEIPYEDIFYRNSDAITATGRRIQLPDRCYMEAVIRLTPKKLQAGADTFDPGTIPRFELLTRELTMPREAMGFGDVKFMAAIGAFLGWPAALFSLTASSAIGAVVGLTLIALKKQDRSARLPYGPYIALAAVLWLFGGQELVIRWLRFSL